jgi:hypothetical protein
MPATTVQQTAGNTGTATPTSVTIDLADPATVGNVLLLVVNCDSTLPTPSGWTLAESQVNFSGLYLWHKTALGGETQVIYDALSGVSSAWWLAEVNGLTLPALDVTAGANTSATATTSYSTGTTATTAQADEFAIAAWGLSDVASDPFPTGSSYTNSFAEQADEHTTKTSGQNVGLLVATKDVGAVGALEATATYAGGGAASCALIAGFKVGAIPPVVIAAPAGSATAGMGPSVQASVETLALDAGSTNSATGAGGGGTTATTSATAPRPPEQYLGTPTYRLLIRDRTGALVGEVSLFTTLTYSVRFNAVGAFTLTMPADAADADLLDFGCGLVVERDGQIVFSGPVTRREKALPTDTGGPGTLTVGGPDDLTVLADRLALPVPLGPPFTSPTRDVRSGKAETVIYGYVDANAGPGARPDRRVPGLTLASDQGRGATVTGSARFDNLLELCAKLALAGGELGLRVVQQGVGLQFQVYDPADRSASVILGREAGSLLGYTYGAERPEANAVIGGSGDEGAERTFVERADTDAIALYGTRVESFLHAPAATATLEDSVVDPVAELTQAVATELAGKVAKTTLNATPFDGGPLRYGRDYSLGDKVTCVIDGVPIADLVREVQVTLGASGEQVAPVIGTPNASTAPNLFVLIRRLLTRVEVLERRR